MKLLQRQPKTIKKEKKNILVKALNILNICEIWWWFMSVFAILLSIKRNDMFENTCKHILKWDVIEIIEEKSFEYIKYELCRILKFKRIFTHISTLY